MLVGLKTNKMLSLPLRGRYLIGMINIITTRRSEHSDGDIHGLRSQGMGPGGREREDDKRSGHLNRVLK